MSVLDEVRAKIKELKEKRGTYWKPEVGDNLIRILAWAEDEPFYCEGKQHFFPWGGREGKGLSTGCMEMIDKPCPGCKLSERLEESDDLEEAKLAERIKAKSVYFMAIVDLKHPDQGVQVWKTYSEKVLMDLLAAFSDGDINDFTDPVSGRNIIITVTKQGGAPSKYEARPKVAASKVQNREWLQAAKKKGLRKLIQAPVLADIQAACGQAPGGSASHGGDDEYPCFGSLFGKTRVFREAKFDTKLPKCIKCPQRRACKSVYTERRADRAKKKLLDKQRRRLGA